MYIPLAFETFRQTWTWTISWRHRLLHKLGFREGMQPVVPSRNCPSPLAFEPFGKHGLGQFLDGATGCIACLHTKMSTFVFAANSAIRKWSKSMFAERFNSKRNLTISRRHYRLYAFTKSNPSLCLQQTVPPGNCPSPCLPKGLKARGI